MRAFSNNNTLATVTCLGTNPPTVFYGNPNPLDDSISFNRSVINLYVPVGTTTAYLNAGWLGFNSVAEGSLSVDDLELKNDVKIITRIDKVEVKHTNNIKLKQYNVYSMSGSKIMEGKENSIPTEALSNGIYILELKFNNGRVSKKFVK